MDLDKRRNSVVIIAVYVPTDQVGAYPKVECQNQLILMVVKYLKK